MIGAQGRSSLYQKAVTASQKKVQRRIVTTKAVGVSSFEQALRAKIV